MICDHSTQRNYGLNYSLQGRSSKSQKFALKNYLKQYLIPYSKNEEDLNSFFPQREKIVLEIGFGDGEGLFFKAKHHANINFLGIEVYRPGIGSLLSRLQHHPLTNLKIITYNALYVLEDQIPNQTIDFIEILFPDPWPKNRHRKRRIISSWLINLIAKKLKREGRFFLLTDSLILRSLVQSYIDKLFVSHLRGKFFPSPHWKIITKYERKALTENRELYQFRLSKIGR